MEKEMKIETRAVHVGDRKMPGAAIPVTTPIHTATSFFYPEMAELDRVFGKEQAGESYSRYGNPTNAALEELVASLENGAGALACSSGMAALQIAIQAALLDRRKTILAADALYGATVSLLLKVFEPFGVDVRFVDMCDLPAVERIAAEHRPGCILMETISNPLLRVGQVDRIAAIAEECGAALVVDNTFASPMVLRPLEHGAQIVVHSLTKFLSGHGDVLGGVLVADTEHIGVVRNLSRIYGPVLGPFESYLAMRGIKTFPLRFERQCRNATGLAAWLVAHPQVGRVNFPGHPSHPDAETIDRLFPADLRGPMLSFELRDARQEEVFAWMDALKLIVRATSLGDVHTMVLYPTMSSHREISPKQRERMGIRDSLIRVSAGIEAIDDIVSDMEQAFAAIRETAGTSAR